MQAKPNPSARMTLPKRFLSVEQFLDDYRNGIPLPIDIDPRIDLTQPIYEQAARLSARDKAKAERAAKGKRRTKAA